MEKQTRSHHHRKGFFAHFHLNARAPLVHSNALDSMVFALLLHPGISCFAVCAAPATLSPCFK
jgi:hypothetical protein